MYCDFMRRDRIADEVDEPHVPAVPTTMRSGTAAVPVRCAVQRRGLADRASSLSAFRRSEVVFGTTATRGSQLIEVDEEVELLRL